MTNQEVIKVLESTLKWLNNIEKQHGTNVLLDAMPNNWCGRLAIEDAIAALQKGETKILRLVTAMAMAVDYLEAIEQFGWRERELMGKLESALAENSDTS